MSLERVDGFELSEWSFGKADPPVVVHPLLRPPHCGFATPIEEPEVSPKRRPSEDHVADHDLTVVKEMNVWVAIA